MCEFAFQLNIINVASLHLNICNGTLLCWVFANQVTYKVINAQKRISFHVILGLPSKILSVVEL